MKEIIAAISVAIMLTSCTFVKIPKNTFGVFVSGTGDSIERSYETSPFSALVLNLAADVEFEVSDKCSVSISAQQDIHDILSVTSEGGVLKIGTQEGTKSNAKNVNVKLSAPTLEDVTVNGAAEIEIESVLHAESFNLTLNGAGDVEIEGLEAGKVNVEINGAGDISANLIGEADVDIEVKGAGDITLKGTARSVNARVTGAGDIDTDELQCDKVTRNIMGLLRKNKR